MLLSNRSLGILVAEKNSQPPFADYPFYRSLCLAGAARGINVFIFAPGWVKWAAQQVIGYTYCKEQGWTERLLPLPRLIYDRYFYNRHNHPLENRRFKSRLARHKDVVVLNRGLKNKWHMHQILSRYQVFHAHLPKTERVKNIKSVLQWLKSTSSFFLKPIAGSQGRGILRVLQLGPAAFQLSGRDHRNQLITMDFDDRNEMLRWLSRRLSYEKYIIQQALSLFTPLGQPYDLRALMQKNGRGHWELTATVIRLGREGVTANIHGGGKPEETESFLTALYGREYGADILTEVTKIAYELPNYLESYCGRLMELGIDFGIDQDGKVWVLEVNSKPGRSALDRKLRKKAIVQPVNYAKFILDRQLGG